MAAGLHDSVSSRDRERAVWEEEKGKQLPLIKVNYMQKFFQFGFLITSLFLLACGADKEAADSEYATLEGLVIDEVMEEGVSGAVISVSSLTTTTDINGAYQIRGLVEGLHELIIQADGYEMSKEPLNISVAKKIHRKTILYPYD